MRVRRSKTSAKKTGLAPKRSGRTPAHPADRPTPELEARVKFELGQVTTETGRTIGVAYRRRPSFKAMKALSPDERDALDYYRTAFDRSERSPVRSCLNISGGGSASGAQSLFTATPGIIEAKRRLAACEEGLGRYRDTMRAVVLDDKSFSQVAIERFGSRITPAPRAGEPVQIRPKSNRHREIVSKEFGCGLRILTDRLRNMVTTGTTEEVWVDPLPDGSATIRRTWVAPLGRYRCWGDEAMVDAVMRELSRRFGSTLDFPTAQDAIDALKDVVEDRLNHLEPEELAE